MGFTEFLTIIFVVLKVFDVISWSWWLVFLPEIIAAIFYVLYVVIHVILAYNINQERKKLSRKFFKDGKRR